MDVQKNSYTFIYSTIIVVIVATLLTIAAVSLQPAQEKNVEVEKKQNILASLHIPSTPKNAEELYSRYITGTKVVNEAGEIVSGVDAFTLNMREDLKLPRNKRHLAIYEARKGDSAFIVIPLYGKGLWGPIWGYISFLRDTSVGNGQPEFNTVYGAVFDHKGETPGLGAEINQPWFQKPFRGKKIFNDKGQFVSIEVVKGGGTQNEPSKVDAISGGTITSKGLQAMLDTCLSVYQNYFKQPK